MNPLTMLKAGIGVLAGKITGRPAPLFVIWAATNRCPSKCSYCRIPERKQKELDTWEVKSLIDQMVGMGTQRLGIWGGEPLMRSDIGEIITYAVKSGLYVTLDSNGYLLPEKIGDLKDLPHLILSLDGPEDVHDKNREAGSFKKTMAAIEAASPKIKELWTITVLTKNNCNEDSIDFLLDLADKYKFTTTYQVLHHGENLGDSVTLRPGDEEYGKILKYLIRKKREGRRIGTSIGVFEHLLNWKDYNCNKLKDPHKNKCWGGRFFVNIDADGRVYPCSLLVDEVGAKNAAETGLREAFESIPEPKCNSCLATCYSEYNKLFNLDHNTIIEWISAFLKR